MKQNEVREKKDEEQRFADQGHTLSVAHFVLIVRVFTMRFQPLVPAQFCAWYQVQVQVRAVVRGAWGEGRGNRRLCRIVRNLRE